jgi:hypothetical protein
MVHHTSPGISRSGGRPTSRNNRSGDRPNIYISRSSSQQACQSDNRPIVKDNRSMDRPTKKSTMSWTHGWSGQASLTSRLDNMDLTESTLTTTVVCGQDLPDSKEVG